MVTFLFRSALKHIVQEVHRGRAADATPVILLTLLRALASLSAKTSFSTLTTKAGLAPFMSVIVRLRITAAKKEIKSIELTRMATRLVLGHVPVVTDAAALLTERVARGTVGTGVFWPQAEFSLGATLLTERIARRAGAATGIRFRLELGNLLSGRIWRQAALNTPGIVGSKAFLVLKTRVLTKTSATVRMIPAPANIKGRG